jgi:hypothetical protein
MGYNFTVPGYSSNGLIVRCKSDNDSVGKLKGLTPDKSYTVTGIDNIGYRIIDDELRNFWYTKELFYPIEEERDRKLNEIGI